MRIFIMRAVSSFLTSRALRNFRRSIHALKRRLSGGKPTVHYFHQPDDPYSHIAAQTLRPLLKRYKIELVSWLVSPPDDAAAPERERLRAYAQRDALRLAAEYGFDFPSNAMPERPRDIVAGDAERKRLGHYLGAMFYFEGEWYWGVDRLNHLEERLAGLGLDTAPKGTPAIAPHRDMKLGPRPASARRPVIEYWFSFRSPYSWISFPRMRRLAKHYDCELRLRFILPMVMRGLPVPRVKRFYIMLDTKREAERARLPFGTVVDPVGAGAARALAVLHHAVRRGRGEDFAELGLRAAFADGIELASDKGMLDVAARAGLVADEVALALSDESWREVAEENRLALFDAGLWGAPTFRVDGKPAHWGQDRFWALEQDILDALEGRNG